MTTAGGSPDKLKITLKQLRPLPRNRQAGGSMRSSRAIKRKDRSAYIRPTFYFGLAQLSLALQMTMLCGTCVGFSGTALRTVETTDFFGPGTKGL